MTSETQAGPGAGTAALLCRTADGVATITITHPAKRNAMTADMWRSLPPMLDRLAVDPDVRVVVLTGDGSTFCSGADISSLTTVDPSDPAATAAVEAENALAAFGKPVVAAIRGWCVGGGCQLAVACDLRIAEEGSRFGITPARIGIVYPGPTTKRLVELIGPAGAKLLLFTGDFFDADRALRLGLVDEVLPPGEFDARVAALATTLAARSQLTLHAAKDIVAAAAAGAPVEALVRHWQAQAQGGETAEGVAAFLERRPAKFPWRPEGSSG